jgi:hypothetical protein
MKSSTDIDEPKREDPNTVNDDPNLANSLRDSDEPRWMKSRTDIDEPKRDDPNTVKDEPNLANSLRDSDEPK